MCLCTEKNIAWLAYSIFVASCFVALIVNMAALLLQVELDPVVESHDLPTIFGLSDKHMLESTGILPGCRMRGVAVMYSPQAFL